MFSLSVDETFSDASERRNESRKMLRARMAGSASQFLNVYDRSAVGLSFHNVNSTFRTSPHPKDSTVVRPPADRGLCRSRSIAGVLPMG